jgi:hypothetical protein
MKKKLAYAGYMKVIREKMVQKLASNPILSKLMTHKRPGGSKMY